jgi:putative ABC transport system ATP-binding protein
MILKCENVSQKYIVEDHEITVLDHINFQVNPAEFLAITGRSGIGKSTLLMIIGTLLSPTDGAVYYNGKNIYDMLNNELNYVRNKMIGFVYQDFKLFPFLTVKENIVMPNIISNNDRDKGYFDYLVDTLELTELLNYLPEKLSGGQKQRTALARALINKPDIIFADEPSGNLDVESTKNLMVMLRELQKYKPFSAVIVTHDDLIFDYVDCVSELKTDKLLMM